MDIILLEKIDNLGNIGDRVKVKSGYGRNYLLPQGKATLATAANIEKFEQIRAKLEAKAAQEIATAEARADKLRALTLSLTAKAGSEGKLFGSIGTVDIAELCGTLGVPVERSEVRLPEGPIRAVGDHEIEFHLAVDLDVSMTLSVAAEESSAE
jgi:large subunit ribosomal protein L9